MEVLFIGFQEIQLHININVLNLVHKVLKENLLIWDHQFVDLLK